MVRWVHQKLKGAVKGVVGDVFDINTVEKSSYCKYFCDKYLPYQKRRKKGAAPLLYRSSTLLAPFRTPCKGRGEAPRPLRSPLDPIILNPDVSFLIISSQDF
ncbi:MAG: hypothetical protein HQL03_03275 [Nitrospirae bacterium]|nr:hypothetical protein [Nitrospirota bacterium]